MNTRKPNPEKDPNKDGYKVPGDGNPPNDAPKAGNASFEQNPSLETAKSKSDIPGTEFNINDKAYNDSSKEDYIKTVSGMHHSESTDESEKDIPGTL